jgi:A/G-specific adenine glycosylase
MTLLNSYQGIIDLHAIRSWFNQHKRDLPWRNTSDPYKIWVSEIMLQQTQVDVVVPYYTRWMELFPTVEALASAEIEAVLKAWEGLGYYSRARNLKKTAETIVISHAKKLPSNREELEKLSGIGSYTAGAILSFAYKQKSPAIDGNVMRVLSRVFFIQDPIDQIKTKKIMYQLLSEILPDDKPYEIMEAFIELGALVCKKKPDCKNCPLQSRCVCHSTQRTHLVPFKSKRYKSTAIETICLILKYDENVFMIQKKKGEWNEGLYEFLSIKVEDDREKTLSLWLEKEDENIQSVLKLSPVKASITTHQIEIFPVLVVLTKKIQIGDGKWIPSKELSSLPKPSAHAKIYAKLKESIF